MSPRDVTVAAFPALAVGTWLKVVACKMTIAPHGNRWRVSAVAEGRIYLVASAGPYAHQLVIAIEELAERVALAKKAKAS